MKYTIEISSVITPRGLELDELYDKLGFPGDHCSRPNYYGTAMVTVSVSREFAQKHRELFFKPCKTAISVNYRKLLSTDFEDWGSHGMVLSADAMTEDRLDTLINCKLNS